MKKMKEISIIFLIGSIGYSVVEILFRGYTHWSMTLTGGACFCGIYMIHNKLRKSKLWIKCLLGAMLITSLEFIVGLLENKVMKWNVWDYSKLRFNVFGQICLLFTTLWFFMCIPLDFFCNKLKKRIRTSVFPWQR